MVIHVLCFFKKARSSLCGCPRLNVMRVKYTVFILIILTLFFFNACAELNVAHIDGGDAHIAWPRPPLKAKIKFVGSISGIQSGQLSEKKGFFADSWEKITGQSLDVRRFIAPYNVTVDEEGILYVVDRDRREIVVIDIDRSSSNILSFSPDKGGYGTDVDDYPVGIAVARDNVYVTYPVRGKIRVFGKSGDFKKEIGSTAGLKRPTGIAVNVAEDRFYVSDTTDHNIKIFNLNGDFIGSFGKRGVEEGEFNYPTHIFAGKNGKIYVNDELNFRVQVFSKEGDFLFKFGQAGMVSGTFQLSRGIAADGEGNIYVADYAADHVQVFNEQGVLLIIFGGSGNVFGRFKGPSGMFIDKKNRIFISDIYNKRVQIFKFVGNE